MPIRLATLIGSWPSPFDGLRGKKLLVVCNQLLIDALPLAFEEMTHHRVALGQGLGFELIQSGILVQELGVGSGNLNEVEVGDLLGLPRFDVDALDQDAEARHGRPPFPTSGVRYPMIRRFSYLSLPPTNLAQHFCALSNNGGEGRPSPPIIGRPGGRLVLK